MYRINSTWKSFDIDLKNLKLVLRTNQYPLSMIDVIKKYLQNAINKTNIGSMPVEMSNIETRYFKLPFIGMYSKVTLVLLSYSISDVLRQVGFLDINSIFNS